MDEVLTVRAARADLPALLDADGPVFVGPHRKPRGVIMSVRAFEAVSERAATWASSLGSVRAEGLEPDEATLADGAAYVRGELTLDEAEARVMARYRAGRRAAAS